MDENDISQRQRNTEIITNRQKNTIGYCRKITFTYNLYSLL